jgi:hypothetical protein
MHQAKLFKVQQAVKENSTATSNITVDSVLFSQLSACLQHVKYIYLNNASWQMNVWKAQCREECLYNVRNSANMDTTLNDSRVEQ